jgi:hypothetical protein
MCWRKRQCDACATSPTADEPETRGNLTTTLLAHASPGLKDTFSVEREKKTALGNIMMFEEAFGRLTERYLINLTTLS